MESTFASLATIDEDARRRFEAAWQEGKPAPIEDFVPSEAAPNRLATLEELIQIELEMGWRSFVQAETATGPQGITRPLVENYLARFPDINQPNILLRLLQQEYRARWRHGDQPSTEEYKKRYPHLMQDIAQILRGEAPKQEKKPVVPGYELLDLLGRGGMGVVYRARQERLNRLVALKLIRDAALAGPDDLARFQTEAEAVAQLQHPNIVQVYEVGTTSTGPFVSLEFLPGGSLDRRLAGAPQPPKLAAQLTREIALAMHHAHLRGIVHRDLKPGNILLLEKSDSAESELPWVAKVADFGLAKRLQADSGQTHTGAVLGTPSYMAPEQARGVKNIGPAADIYALGAILYEMLTGRPPFRAASSWDTIQQVLNEEPIPPNQLQSRTPTDLATICLKCLQKDPARRYSTGEALAQDLDRFLADQPILARPVSRSERVLRWARRNPLVAGLATAIFFLLAGGLFAVTVLWQLAESRREQAEGATEAIRKQKQAADESSRQARKAVRESFTLATGHPVFQRDNMQPARQVLLETAKRYFEEFIQQRSDDPELEAEVADALFRLGIITDALGNMLQAQQYFEEARSKYESLLDAPARNASVEMALAQTQCRLGNVRFSLGEIESARSCFQSAIDRLERLAAADPDNLGLQNQLARARIDLAGLQYKRDRGDHAVRNLLVTRDQLRTLAAKASNTATYRNLSACLVMLGQALEHLGRYEEAATSLKEAIPIHERLVKLTDQEPHERAELARIHGSLGLVLGGQGKRREAIQAYETAAAMRETLVATNPSVLSYQLDLATVHYHLGEEYREMKAAVKAIEHLQKSSELFVGLSKAQPEVPRHYEGIALCHISLNKLKRMQKDSARAFAHLDTARKNLDETLKREPNTLVFRHHDASWYIAHAEALRHGKEYERSEKEYDQARQRLIELARLDPKNPAYRRDLALALTNQGYLASLRRDTEHCLKCYVDAYVVRNKLAQEYPTSLLHQTNLTNAHQNVLGAVTLFLNRTNDASLKVDLAAYRQKCRMLLTRLSEQHPEVPHLRLAALKLAP